MKIFLLILMVFALCSCNNKEEVFCDPTAPVIEFEAKAVSEDGIKEFYLFDDNPEYLNKNYLADGDSPSAIASFKDLQEGIYTVFSYHHRGESAAYDEDLFFDTVFSGNGKIELLSLGLDHDWNWNQAWADFTGVPVFAPRYLKNYNCTCGNEIHKSGCDAVIENQYWYPDKEYKGIGETINIESPLFLSDIVKEIETEGINRFRYGSSVEPMWLVMKFRILEGSVDFHTVAYKSKEDALSNTPAMSDGSFWNEPQYKGIAKSAPITTAEFSCIITKETKSGPMPVTVKNSRVPNGYTIRDGTFATYINTWREKLPIAAESDMLPLSYTDDNKTALGGTDNIWRFDPYHTKLYEDSYGIADKLLLKKYNIKTGEGFVPNIPMSEIKHPFGTEECEDGFYRLAACNLGNFGVTTQYIIHIDNLSQKDKCFVFRMDSDAGQVYRFNIADEQGNITDSDSGYYIMKMYDNDPAEDPVTKARLEPAWYKTDVPFFIPAGEKRTVTMEITTLTGCNAPMRNTLIIEKEDG